MKIDKTAPVPAYHQLRLILEDDIRKGRYEIGGRFPTEMTLAKRCGLSRMTVRQALAALEQDGFILREQGRGTFVARIESSRENHAVNLGVVIYRRALEAQWFFPELLAGIHAGLSGKRANLILIPFDEKTEGVPSGDFLVRTIRERSLDGLFVTAEELGDRELIRLREDGFPFACVNLSPDNGDLDYICPDYAGGIARMTSHMIALGHRRIAFVGTLFLRYHLERLMQDAFLTVMRRNSLVASPAMVKEAAYLGANVPDLVGELLALRPRPTAVVCTDDTLAARVIYALRDADVRVPRDVSVSGLNDLPLAGVTRPALTTLAVPRRQMGCEAAEFLHGAVRGRGGRLRRKLPLELVERGSAGPVPRDGEKLPRVRRAIAAS